MTFWKIASSGALSLLAAELGEIQRHRDDCEKDQRNRDRGGGRIDEPARAEYRGGDCDRPDSKAEAEISGDERNDERGDDGNERTHGENS